MDDELWTDKYKPKTLNDFIINNDIKIKIKKWLNDFKTKKNTNNCLFLVGPPGVGKTTISHLILKEFNYDIIELNASDIRTQKLVRSKIEDILGKRNVLNLLCKKNKEIAIIMDEIDGMTMGERSGLSELIKIIAPKKNFIAKNKSKYNYLTINPFICISNTLDKKLNDLKAKSTFIKFSNPSNFLLNKYAKQILSKENITIDEEILNIIVSKCQFDYRRLLILLEYVYKSNIVLDKESVINLLENFENKNINHTYYECIDKMFKKYNGIDKTIELFNSNKSLIPMIIYENFNEYIIKNKTDTKDVKLDNILKIYKNYSDSDIIDYKISINQCWSLYNTNCIFKCVEPSYIMNNMKKASYNKYNTLNFSSLLNKVSQEYLNIKTTININTKIFNLSNTNMLYYFADIIYTYLENNDINKVKEIIEYYNISTEEIDKLNKYLCENRQKQYTLKKRNEIKNLLYK